MECNRENILFILLVYISGARLIKSDNLNSNEVHLGTPIKTDRPNEETNFSTAIKSGSNLPPPNVFEYVDSLYEDFIYFSNKTLLDALERLEQINNNTMGLENKATSIVSAQLKAMTDGFMHQIGSLETQAKGFTGVDIAKCEGDGAKEIKALPKLALEAVSQCIAMPKSIITDQINTVIHDMNKLPEKWIKIFGVYLRQCKNNVRSLQPACAANLGTKISQVKATFYSTVEKTIMDILNIFPTLKNDAVRCTTNQLAAVSSRAAIIVSDLTSCTNQIMFAVDLSIKKNKASEAESSKSIEVSTAAGSVVEEMPDYT